MGDAVYASWILQADPNRYKLPDKIDEHKGLIVTWYAKIFFDRMKKDDLVYIWQSAKGVPQRAGFYGWGRVLSDPYEDEPDEKGVTKFVDVEYIGKFEPFIPKSEILKNKYLSSMTIIKTAQGVNFGLTVDQDAELEKFKKTRGLVFDTEEISVIKPEEEESGDLNISEIFIKGHTDEDVILYVDVRNETSKTTRFRVRVTSSFPNSNNVSPFYRIKAGNIFSVPGIRLGKPRFTGNTSISIELIDEEETGILHQELEVNLSRSRRGLAITIVKSVLGLSRAFI